MPLTLKNPISVPLNAVVPTPDMFAHASDLHGQKHVSRVMIHAFLLVDLLKMPEYALPLWACVYLHDLARVHDGVAHEHGADAVTKFHCTPDLHIIFHQAGLERNQFSAIETAVTWHSLPNELEKDHPHWSLTALLKDADGLDRVRLGDLNPDYFRYDASKKLVPFAEDLYTKTHSIYKIGDEYFPKLWPQAGKLWEQRQGE